MDAIVTEIVTDMKMEYDAVEKGVGSITRCSKDSSSKMENTAREKLSAAGDEVLEHVKAHAKPDTCTCGSCDICSCANFQGQEGTKTGLRDTLISSEALLSIPDRDNSPNHSRIGSDQELYSHKCEICGKSYQNLVSKKKHMKIHSKVFKCDVCGKSFTTLGSKKAHIRLHSNEGPHRCQTCGKVFRQKSHLTDHNNIHTGEKPHVCDVCGKAFGRIYLYTEHMKTHSGTSDRLYQCDVCGATLKKNSVRRHVMKCHPSEKPYRCSVCSRFFSTIQVRQAHMESHLAARELHECEACGKTFPNESKLKEHCLMHTGEKPFSCEVCGKSYARKQSVKRHMLLHPNMASASLPTKDTTLTLNQKTIERADGDS